MLDSDHIQITFRMPSFEFAKSEAEFRNAVSSIHKLWCDCGNYLRHLEPRGGWSTLITKDGDSHPDQATGEESITDEDLGTALLDGDTKGGPGEDQDGSG